jgi:hypothetical protein
MSLKIQIKIRKVTVEPSRRTWQCPCPLSHAAEHQIVVATACHPPLDTACARGCPPPPPLKPLPDSSPIRTRSPHRSPFFAHQKSSLPHLFPPPLQDDVGEPLLPLAFLQISSPPPVLTAHHCFPCRSRCRPTAGALPCYYPHRHHWLSPVSPTPSTSTKWALGRILSVVVPLVRRLNTGIASALWLVLPQAGPRLSRKFWPALMGHAGRWP